jgi:hypothetical protein
MKLARCFLVFLALKTTSYRDFLKDQPGKLPAAVKKHLNKQRKRVNEVITLDDMSDDCAVSNDEFESRSNNESDFSAEENSNDSCSRDSSHNSSMEHDSDDSGGTSSRKGSSLNESGDDSTYDHHADFESKDPIIFTESVYDTWTELFENILLFYGWLKSEKLPCNIFKHGALSVAKHCTESFMKEYREVAYRYEGMGLKLTKFHQMRHWYFYISMYGVPTNFDSSFCESHHIHHTKKTGRRTQKRQDELAQQTAQRVYEGSLLNEAIRRTRKTDPQKVKRRNLPKHSKMRGSKFTITFDYSHVDNQVLHKHQGNDLVLVGDFFQQMPHCIFKWKHKRNHNKKTFPQVTLDSDIEKLAWFNNGLPTKRICSIVGSTEFRLNCEENLIERDIIRAHPDYRKDGIWFDWVDVTWEGIGDDPQDEVTLPAQVIMILDFDCAEFETIPEEIVTLFPILSTEQHMLTHPCRKGIHLLVHSADHNNEAGDATSIGERFVMEPFFQIIESTNVSSVAFVARDPPLIDADMMNFRSTKVKNPELWGQAFIPRFIDGYNDPHENQLHLDEFNENFNPW